MEKFIRIEVTNDMNEEAVNDIVKQHGRSHRKSNYFVTGRIAELAVHKILGQRASLCSEDNRTYDILYVAPRNNRPIKIDVKGKRRNFDRPPAIDWDISITDFQKYKTNKPDFYAHVAVNYEKDIPVSCYLVGFTTPSEYFNGSEELRKIGDIDPSNGQRCSIKCWNRKYSCCVPFDNWLKSL
jgi:hypothetical protein